MNPLTESTDLELLQAVKESAEKYLRERGGLSLARHARADAHSVWPHAEFSRKDWLQMAELGWPGMLVPEVQGGLGLPVAAAVEVAVQLGQWLAPEPGSLTMGVVAPWLAASDSPQAPELLEAVINGACILGVSLDLDAASTAEGLRCHRQGESTLLSGSVPAVSPAHPVDGWLLMARDEAGGWVLVHVRASSAGLSVRTDLQADGRFRARLDLEALVLGPADILAQGDAALGLLKQGERQGQILLAAECLGMAERLHQMTLDYVAERKQFGRAIGSFQVLQHRCVDVRIQLELARASVMAAAAETACEADVLRAKWRATRAAMDAGLVAVHLHGAMGITDECDVGLYFTRVLSQAPRLGPERALQQRWLALGGDAHEVAGASASDWTDDFPRSTDWDAMPEPEFRRMIRAFLARHYPSHLRHMPRRVHWDEIGEWYLCLSRQGWIAPAWPAVHGGMGLPAAKQLAWFEEFESYGVARAPDQGILMVGPVLMQFGTPAQQQQFLPRILSGEHIWCQGYSEPGAGSDLASLRTEAVLEGEHFVVTGQKIWTTLAQDATHIFMLVRTDKTVKPQAGISFLLCDIRSPGITVRPIRDLAGHSEFCEVFFDQVKVPREQLVGQLNEGWTIAKALLGFERLHLGSPKQSQHALGQLRTLGREAALMDDAAFRADYAALAMDVADLAAIYTRYGDHVRRGERLPASVSMLKVWATDTYQRIGLAMARYAGLSGGLAGAVRVGEADMHLLAPLFNGSAARIYGGSNEVQRNILARAVLELPD